MIVLNWLCRDSINNETPIEPIIEYIEDNNTNNRSKNKKKTSLEMSCRNIVSSQLFNNNKKKLDNLLNIKYYEREDDDCCAHIREAKMDLNKCWNKCQKKVKGIKNKIQNHSNNSNREGDSTRLIKRLITCNEQTSNTIEPNEKILRLYQHTNEKIGDCIKKFKQSN